MKLRYRTGTKIGDAEARARRKAYMAEHRDCWCLLPRSGGGVVLCLLARPVCHHLTGGRGLDEYEQPANYYPLGDRPGHDHHKGWAHGQDAVWQMTQREARLWCFALKLGIGEVTVEQAAQLMRGRGLLWWRPEMGAEWTLADELGKRAAYLWRNLVNKDSLKKACQRGGIWAKLMDVDGASGLAAKSRA